MVHSCVNTDRRKALSTEVSNWPEWLVDVTDNLVIRQFTAKDVNDYYALVHCLPKEYLPELYDLSFEEFSEHLAAYIEYQYGFYGYGNFGVFLSADRPSPNADIEELISISDRSSVLIGLVGLKNGSDSKIGELSYGILPKYRRRGYAFEATRSVMEYGLECGFASFEARIKSDNTASLNLASKLELTILPI